MPHGARPPRADAQRNRERLLAAAARAFPHPAPRAGTQVAAEVSLEAIAREAGVGIATLYRHFPTRSALLEAAYRADLATLAASAAPLLAELPPDLALRAWLDRSAACLSGRPGLAAALRDVLAAPAGEDRYAATRDGLIAAVGALLRAGIGTGAFAVGAEPADVLAGMTGACLAAADAGQTRRLLDLLMSGLRAG